MFGGRVRGDFLGVIGVGPALGRFFLPDEDKKPGGNNIAVLSYSLWSSKFGSDVNVIGKTVTLNATPYTVIGVGPRGFKGNFTLVPTEMVWIPVSMYTQVFAGFFRDNFNDRRLLGTVTVGRLRTVVSLR